MALSYDYVPKITKVAVLLLVPVAVMIQKSMYLISPQRKITIIKPWILHIISFGILWCISCSLSVPHYFGRNVLSTTELWTVSTSGGISLPDIAVARKRLLLETANQTDLTNVYNQPNEGAAARGALGDLVPTNTWELSPILPGWMKNYFRWHHEVRVHLNEANWQSYRYLVVRCLRIDDRCGGASDRLQMIPLAVLLAHQFHRVLFIKWERPASLEEYLVPPQGGMNWSIPAWLEHRLTFRRMVTVKNDAHIKYMQHNQNSLVDMRYQVFDHGKQFYNASIAPGEPGFDDVYRDLWGVMFEPSPPVKALIRQTYRQLGLRPAQYIAVHHRSRFYKDKTTRNELVHNAVHCGSRLGNQLPIFFAGDSAQTVRNAVLYGQSQGLSIVARHHLQDPLHLDRGTSFLSQDKSDWMRFPPESYYDIFLDLYLLAGSACVGYNVGGFGHWGRLLSHNRSCTVNHALQKCLR